MTKIHGQSLCQGWNLSDLAIDHVAFSAAIHHYKVKSKTERKEYFSLFKVLENEELHLSWR